MRKKGFTLIELLVVISIIALLLSILLPALQKVKSKAMQVVCLSNCSQLGKAGMLYAADNNDRLPLSGRQNDQGRLYSRGAATYPYGPYWDVVLLPYVGAKSVSYESLGYTSPGEIDADYDQLQQYESYFELYQCSESVKKNMSAAKMLEGRNLFPRTYRINAYISGEKAGPDGNLASQSQRYANSTKQSSIKSPAHVMFFADTFQPEGMSYVGNLWGQYARYWMDIYPTHSVKLKKDAAFQQVNPWGLPKMTGISNYVFCDGHAESLKTQFTEFPAVYSPAYRDYADPIEGVKLSPNYNW